MSLPVIQRILVASALAWALLPGWGAPVYLAAWLLLLLGTQSRIRRARQVVDAEAAGALKSLDEESRAFVRRHAFPYVWRDWATKWGVLWRVTALIAFLLAPWFVIRAFVTGQWWELGLLVPLAVYFLVGGAYGSALQLDEWLGEGDHARHRERHGTITTLLSLKSAVGLWPPQRAPDEPAE